jgi:hypothetical protein
MLGIYISDLLNKRTSLQVDCGIAKSKDLQLESDEIQQSDEMISLASSTESASTMKSASPMESEKEEKGFSHAAQLAFFAILNSETTMVVSTPPLLCDT